MTDTQQCDRLTLRWLPATSTNPNADIVYDIYRLLRCLRATARRSRAFTPSRQPIASGVSGTSFTDTGLTRNQPYYYIVQARDRNNGRIDTNNNGNRSCASAHRPRRTLAARRSLPKRRLRPQPPTIDSPPLFRIPPRRIKVWLHSSAFRTSTLAVRPRPGCMRRTLIQVRSATGDGAPSDFSAIIGPFTLTADSVMEFDHLFNTEIGLMVA